MDNVMSSLTLLWRDHHDDCATFVESGEIFVRAFHPSDDAVEPSDRSKLATAGFMVLAAIQHSIEGPIPDPVIKAVAQIVTSTYGLGVRRGKGIAYKKSKNKDKSVKFVHPETKETLPSRKRTKALKKFASQKTNTKER